MEERGGATTLVLCGDVMLGRGIDQILPHPCDPRLYETNASSALDYVTLAEGAHGPIPRAVDFRYVWGDALATLDAFGADARIVNLETCITFNGEPEPKGINYRMSPRHVGCLTAAKIDCSVLANNHTLDWGRAGLLDTLDALAAAGIRTAGAGRDAEAAAAPAICELPGERRVLVFAFGATTSGIPVRWSAGPGRPGINVLHDLSRATVGRIVARVQNEARSGGILVASIHWGGNWGFEVPEEQQAFAHALIDEAGFDVIHGHSSHHAKAVEVYRGKLVLYGCGDFLNDYEGIAPPEPYRDDLAIAYVPRFSPEGRLEACRLVPFNIRKFRLNRPARRDVDWLQATLDRECARFGTRVAVDEDELLTLLWG